MSRTKFVRMARIHGGKSEGSHTMTAGPDKALTNWARISMGCPTAVGKDIETNAGTDLVRLQRFYKLFIYSA